MQIPAVAFIESALEQLQRRDVKVVHDEVQEFRATGNRIARMRFPEGVDVSSLTPLERGYLVGLETARVLISGMPAAYKDGKQIFEI